MMENYGFDKTHLEYLRSQAKSKFDPIRGDWIDYCMWAAPNRANWMLSQTPGQRRNRHIVDGTHILALRSFVAGFMEGNTSATRPWYRCGTADKDLNMFPTVHDWLDRFTTQTLQALQNSNFYHASGQFYYDYGVVNTGSYYIDERENNTLFFHVLEPGSYFVLNNAYGEAVIMVREFSMTVKSVVDTYGRKKNGSWNWENISPRIKKSYQDGNYAQNISVVQIIKENDRFDPNKPQAYMNRKWISYTYELGGSFGQYYQDGTEFGWNDVKESNTFLEIRATKRKPFIVGRSYSSSEYGDRGPTTDALGLIKSLNKKAIGKDQALEQMLRPTIQGPSNLKKNYITTAPNAYIPLDAQSIARGKGLSQVFEVNPGIGALIQDVTDMRQQVDRFYYADYLLYLSRNPKTRTATETDAIVKEQQLVIGPNLQSLNYTHNVPIVDYVMDFTLDNDPILPPPPEELEGRFLRPEFISVFAQAQRAADIPSIERYLQFVMGVGNIDPRVFDKVNLDKIADIYEDRLYLPAGVNRDDSEVEAIREQAQAMAQRQAQMEQLALGAKAAKDVGIQATQPQQEVQGA